ncbi:MAG TPA: TonB-dependent receptor [Chitinophagaceae bacterium]
MLIKKIPLRLYHHPTLHFKKRIARSFSFFFLLFLCLNISLYAQKNITGKVTSANDNKSLAGASVEIKGQAKGTTTDTGGNYSITAPDNAVLVFRYVGFADQEINVGGQSVINVAMTTGGTGLNEVVVIGYQAIRKKDLTGATGVVNTANSNKIVAASVGEQIQGLVPGVTVRNGGAPGQNPVIEIRGVASFTNSSPLYVIDGMIADANSTINTDDIASVQILKDASAAAIYGSRAANGVIIITTKRGRNGPSKISASARYGIQQIPKKWDVMDAPQYLQTVKTQYENSGTALPAGIAAQLASNTINTDWQDEIYRTGNTQDYNIALSGGAQTGNYLLSASYYKSQGVLISNSFERASLRINTEIKKGRLTVGENMVLSNSNGKNPGGGVNAFYEAPQMLPIIAVQSEEYKTQQFNPGGWGFGTNEIPTFANNYVAVAALDKQTYNYAKIVGNGYVDFRFTDWLSYRFNAGLEASFDYYKEVRDSGIWRYENQVPATSVNEDRERFTNILMEHTLNFGKTFGVHNINGVVGYSYQQVKRETTSGGKIYLKNANGQLFTTISSAGQGIPGEASAAGGVPDFYRIQGFLGRVNYSYNDKYLFTFSGRIDQDSRFGPNYQTGDFYSAAASWRISKEKFFNVKWISDLKLRGSYGQLGINTLSSWEFLGVINNSARAVYGEAQSPVVGEYQAQIVNPDLRWEKRNETNIGLDAALLNNKILVTIDLYNNLSKDVLVNLPLPYYLGSASASAAANAGSIRNKGIEISATYKQYQKAFKWDVSVNGTTIKNKVESVGNQGVGVNYIEGSPFSRSQVGHPMDEWFMLETSGIFQSQEEIDNYKNKDGQLIQPNAKPGDIKYIDQNGDGTINNDDRTFLGSPWPTFQGGLQFNATYKDFSLNIQFVGVFGYKIYDDIRRVLDGYQNTNFRKDISPWTSSNKNTGDPRLGIETGDPGITDNNLNTSARWLENGSYVRLRNVELGYNLPGSLLRKITFSSARIFVSGQNLFTVTKYKGLDPDVTGSGVLLRGFDNGNWPSSRIISFGLQFEF